MVSKTKKDEKLEPLPKLTRKEWNNEILIPLTYKLAGIITMIIAVYFILLVQNEIFQMTIAAIITMILLILGVSYLFYEYENEEE